MWNDLIQGKEFCIDGVEREPLGLTEHDGSRAQSCLSTFTAGSLHSGLRKNFDMRFCSQLKQEGGKIVLMMQWYQALDLVWRELKSNMETNCYMSTKPSGEAICPPLCLDSVRLQCRSQGCM